MTLADAVGQVGPVLRDWRLRRRLSQLDVALDAGISARHLSFVETGRSKPGRELLIRVLGVMSIPGREQNQLLMAAGHAPAFPERSLEHPDLAPVRQALDLILKRHEPYPAIVVDRNWDLLAANAAIARLTRGVDVNPELVKPPVNALRLGLHPDGLGARLVNPLRWKGHFLQRLKQQAATWQDPLLIALIDEIDGYHYPSQLADDDSVTEVLGPLRFRGPDGAVLSFFGMFATFDTPFEVNASELALELLFPADEATVDALRDPGLSRGEEPNGS